MARTERSSCGSPGLATDCRRSTGSRQATRINEKRSAGVEGYEAIDCPHSAESWGGLEGGHGSTLLNGSKGGNWYYAIGSYAEWGGGIPGPRSAVKCVELHAREPVVNGRWVLVMRQTVDGSWWKKDQWTLGVIFQSVNPPEGDRTYSSVWRDNAIGTAHARSMLDSPQAWSARTNAAGQWMRIDAGEVVPVSGVRAQGRNGSASHQKVTAFTVQHSTDDSTWSDVDGGATFTDASGSFDALFTTPVMARYIRINVVVWASHISMRAGLLKA